MPTMLNAKRPSDNTPMPKITRLLRAAAKLACALLAGVALGVVAGDVAGLNYSSALSFPNSSTLTNCNKVVGARVLFWSLLLFEFPLWALIARYKFSPEDIDAFDVRRDRMLSSTKWHDDRWFLWKFATATFILTIVGWWGSYDLAYDNGTLCSSKSVASHMIDYWHLLGVNGLRALCALLLGLIIFMTFVTWSKRRAKYIQPHATCEQEFEN